MGIEDALVLTNETPEATQAFYESRTGHRAPEPAKAPEGEQKAVESEAKKPEPVKADADGEGNDDVEQHVPNPEARQKVHYRFSELTERAKAAEAKASEAAAKADSEARARVEAEQRAEALRAKYEPPKTNPLGPAPQRAQFVNDDEFAKALEDHVTEKITLEREQKDRSEKVTKAWQERQGAAKAALPDYQQVIDAGADLKVSDEVRDAILESEQGPQILYHLAKNPSLVADLAGMGDKAQLRLIGKLEGKFEGQPSAPAPTKADEKPQVVAAEISRAPAPISPLKSSKATPDSPVDADGNYHGTYEQYKAARKAGKIT